MKENTTTALLGRLMRFQVAVIEKKGVACAVAIVNKSIIDNRFEAGMAMQSLNSVLPDRHIILMAYDNRGTPTYYGRSDIVQSLAATPLSDLAWREYHIE